MRLATRPSTMFNRMITVESRARLSGARRSLPLRSKRARVLRARALSFDTDRFIREMTTINVHIRIRDIFERTTAALSLERSRERATVEPSSARASAQCGICILYSRPSDRSGPGCVSTDRNVRSKCRCSNVSCSSHYDAQLTAFFIDPRAK